MLQSKDPSPQYLDDNFSDYPNTHKKTRSDNNGETDSDEAEFYEPDTNEFTTPSTETMLHDVSNLSIIFATGKAKGLFSIMY